MPTSVRPLPGANLAVLVGALSRPPELRTLPSGDHLLALEVTVRTAGQPADTVPVAWFGAPERATAWSAGHEVVVVGRVRRRFFQAGGRTQSRVEVVASSVLPASRRRSVSAAIVRAADELAAVARA